MGILGTPDAPSIPRVTDTHKDSISLAWTRPVEDGGTDIIGYILEMQEVGSEEWTKVHEKNIRMTEYTVTGLAAGKKYCFIVAAVNVNGTGDFSEPCPETEPMERIGMFKHSLCFYNIGCDAIYSNILCINARKKKCPIPQRLLLLIFNSRNPRP